MPAAKPAVFWVCGASGAGKSVAAWALFEALAAEGVRVGYVDIDQLGMLYPADGDGPERHLLKEGALVALVPGYASAGAQVLIVSGVVDPEFGPAALALDGDLTLCLLLVDPAVLRERIRARGCDEEEADEAVAENAALRDATFVDAAVDTAGLSVAEIVERLRPSVRVVGLPPVVSPSVVRSPAELGVVVVTGPRRRFLHGGIRAGDGQVARRSAIRLRRSAATRLPRRPPVGGNHSSCPRDHPARRHARVPGRTRRRARGGERTPRRR